MSELYIFPDTNLFMHYERPDQIDWCKLSGVDKVVLTFAPVVIGELDKHKNQHPVRRLKDRARDIVSWMRSLEDGTELRQGVSVEFVVREPGAAVFGDGLDSAIPDDRIIASVLEHASSGRAVAVATNDTLLSRKVRSHGVRWIEVPERHRLKEEPDPLEAENARLKRENRELVHRLPKPTLLWTEHQEQRVLTITLVPEGDHLAKPDQMRLLHQALPSRKEPTSMDPWARFRLGMLSDEQIEAYNSALPTFYVRYAEYYEAELTWRDRSRRTLNLNFSAGNQGTASANDVTITVTFPERLQVIDPKQQPGRPDKPQPPELPQPGMPRGLAAMMAGATAYASPLGDISALYRQGIDLRRPILNIEHNSARFELPKLQHGWVTELNPVYCLADGSLIGSAAALGFEITADELPSAIAGELILKVAKPA